MKPLVLLALAALAVAATAVQAQPTVRTCRWEVKSRCAEGSATVTLVAGVPSKVSVDSFWCGRRGTPGYLCLIDYQRGDKQSTWTEEGGTLVIANQQPSNPALPDQLRVTVGKHISIDLDQAQNSGNCGAGAELPRAIVIPEGKAICRVWLQSP